MDKEERRQGYVELHEDLQQLRNEVHGIRAELLRLERMIHENEKNMQPIIEVYEKILASSEVGGFMAKILGGILGILAAIASLWLIFKGGGSGNA